MPASSDGRQLGVSPVRIDLAGGFSQVLANLHLVPGCPTSNPSYVDGIISPAAVVQSSPVV